MAAGGQGGIRPVRWHRNTLVVIDQTRLPQEYVERTLRSVEDVAEAINRLRVRGAPLIGITAAYGVALAASLAPEPTAIRAAIDQLRATRPTARDLFAALDRMERAATHNPADPARVLLDEALAIHAADLTAGRLIATQAAQVFTTPGWTMTICNTGALATGGEGTALGLIAAGYRLGLVSGVYVLETRPILQGARLTAWELQQLDIPFQLLPDSAAASLIATGRVAAIATGADRIARNGDTANKVGTRMLAELADRHQVPFHIVAPRTTFDAATPSGAAIPIEQRAGVEVMVFNGQPVAPDGTTVYNPAFDVTDAGLIGSYVTDAGVFAPNELEDSRIWN
ncbi:S-methyl-5-thioribose-1-phosphate isomerase [bacterium]|nr:S-methyl-5-thioribose-1-phosphate isomerase [bacterium]